MTATPLRRVPCARCLRMIAWVKTREGRSMPIDPDPSERGNVYLTAEHGKIIATVGGHGKTLPGIRHMPHFATCGEQPVAQPKPEPSPQLDLFNQP